MNLGHPLANNLILKMHSKESPTTFNFSKHSAITLSLFEKSRYLRSSVRRAKSEKWKICNWIVKQGLFLRVWFQRICQKKTPAGISRVVVNEAQKSNNNKRTPPKRLMPTNGFSFILRGHSFFSILVESFSRGRSFFPAYIWCFHGKRGSSSSVGCKIPLWHSSWHHGTQLISLL